MTRRYDGNVTYDYAKAVQGSVPKSPITENYTQYVDFSYDEEGNIIASNEKDLTILEKINVQMMDNVIDNSHDELVKEELLSMLNDTSLEFDKEEYQPIEKPISGSENYDKGNVKKLLGLITAPLGLLGKEALSSVSEETKKNLNKAIGLAISPLGLLGKEALSSVSEETKKNLNKAIGLAISPLALLK